MCTHSLALLLSPKGILYIPPSLPSARSLAPSLPPYTDIKEELDHRARQGVVGLHHYHCEQETPYSEQDEDDRDEEKLHLYSLHRRFPALSQNALVLPHLKESGATESLSSRVFNNK